MMSVGLALAGGMPHKTMLGTSMVAQIGPGLAGAWAHARLGNLRVDLVPALAAGAMIGSFVTSEAAVDAPEEGLRAAFAAFVAGRGDARAAGGAEDAQGLASSGRKTNARNM